MAELGPLTPREDAHLRTLVGICEAVVQLYGAIVAIETEPDSSARTKGMLEALDTIKQMMANLNSYMETFEHGEP